ncbi:hypothetical protein O7632_13265 [Solwaraspora sp. WMMD406]|uniref:WXG100 family type VII secretion target n=1 Tax=Solwaraspora sp. WMMD406 TaxID=3016095 RepID=UPI0024170956|nr:hypothetical protein [Solwaraspora sp. WMMD406]MDG4765060.1 hypothetical protein [Solwaraspora sp. WMMD406]
MTQPIHVNNVNLGGELDGLRSLVVELDSALDAFETTAGPILVNWTGSAPEEYRVAKANWDRLMGELGMVLNSTPQVISEIAQYHVMADHRSAGYFA